MFFLPFANLEKNTGPIASQQNKIDSLYNQNIWTMNKVTFSLLTLFVLVFSWHGHASVSTGDNFLFGESTTGITVSTCNSAIVNNNNNLNRHLSKSSGAMVAIDMLTVQLYTTQNYNNGGPVHDSFGIHFAIGNDNALTPADAVKPMNFFENLGVNHNGTVLSYESREMPQVGEVFNMYSSGYQSTSYVLKMNVSGLQDAIFYLEDSYTGSSTLVDAGITAYSFTINQSIPASKATNRFLIRVDMTTSCPEPTAVTVTNVTQDTASISWIAGNSETKWEVIYGAAGFDPIVTGTTETVSPNPFVTLSGLSSNLEYDFYVKAICGAVNSSNLVGPGSFTTQCAITTLPYLLDFESAVVPNIPACTSQENLGTGNNWETFDQSGNGFNSKVLRHSSNLNDAANIWFYTQGMELEAGTDYRISYKYGNDNQFGDTEKMRVAYGTSPLSTNMTNVLANHPSITSGIATSNTVIFSPSTTDVYYFGFQAYSDSDQYSLFLDDIDISVYSGYTYENGIWTPEDPSGITTSVDNILVINGNASFTANTDVNNLTIQAGATLEIHNILNLYGDIANYGHLIFMSNATGCGELGLVSGTSNITGNATIHQYMSFNRSYRMVSSAVTTTTSIHDNWQEGAESNSDNPFLGFGTHITGSTIDQQNGFDGTDTGNPSMFTVNVDDQQFQQITNTNVSILEAGTPYLLFVRGDRTIDLTNNFSAGETVLRANGLLYTGNQTQDFPTANNGDFVMFGNPYQSAVDVSSVFSNPGSNNLNLQYYYVYDPTIADHGAYVIVDYTNGTNNNGSSFANQYLQPGQAAQVAVTGPASVVFEEGNKAPGNFTATNRVPMSESNMLAVQLYTTENFNNEDVSHDAFMMFFAEDNDNELTQGDAVKAMNFYENLGIDHQGTYLGIEQREMPQPAEVFSLYTSGYNHSNYTLKMMVDGLEGTSLYLEDHFTGLSTRLEVGDNAYSFNVDANNPLSIATDRFSIRTEERLDVESQNLLSGIQLFPNPLSGNTFYLNAPQLNGEELNVSINDLSGRRIFEHTLNCNANTVAIPMGKGIASGVYLVTLRHGEEVQTYQLIKE